MKLINQLKPFKRIFAFCFFILHSSFLIPNNKRGRAFSSFRIMLLLLILHSSFLITNCFSQWSQIATINSTELRGVKFFNEWTGITVGVGGIWRSTNSGVNWTQVLSGVNMNSLSFPDINTGFAVGDSGKIYKTIDNGLNWTPHSFNTTNNLLGVSFFNSTTGHAVGSNGIILRTSSAGVIWNQNMSPTSENINYVQMIVNTQTAFAVGGVTVESFMATGNGGNSWVVLNLQTNSFLKSGAYKPNPYGYYLVVGKNGKILKSTNGASWIQMTSPTTQTLNCVILIDTSNGYAVGNLGVIIKTTTSGSNWASESSGTSLSLNSVSFINLQTGWAVGQSGVVLRKGKPVNIELMSSEFPAKFKLYQNYPNPFNPETSIRFDIKETGHVKLIIYDVYGKEIRSLINDYKISGQYKITFIASDLPSGVYFYKFIVNSIIRLTKKMILIN